MQSFLILFRFTSQGITNIKDSPNRIGEAKKIFEQFGVKVKHFYVLMGDYDSMFIVESTDCAAVAKACFSLASLGNVRSKTLAAFSEDEYKNIVDEL